MVTSSSSSSSGGDCEKATATLGGREGKLGDLQDLGKWMVRGGVKGESVLGTTVEIDQGGAADAIARSSE